MPVRKKVESSAIGSIAWNKDTQELTVYFTKRGAYVYFNVTQGEYLAFLNAPSLGTYFNNEFKLAHGYARK